MDVCSECGFNHMILGTHSPGCSQFSQEDLTKIKTDDDTSVTEMLIDSAADRAMLTLKTLISGYSEEDSSEIDDIFRPSAWLGAASLLQVFIEQELLSSDAVRKFLSES